VPDTRPLSASDLSAANRWHDEQQADSPWFRLWQRYGICCRAESPVIRRGHGELNLRTRPMAQIAAWGDVEITMTDEIVFHHGTTMVRRLRPAPGEAMPWHRDPFQRLAVILGGALLLIEYRDGGESQSVEITPGEAQWEEPTARVHRAVNVGRQPYEQVTVFLLDHPDAVPQPGEE
jgi:quercetin dioxygenase-like cupin family protein